MRDTRVDNAAIVQVVYDGFNTGDLDRVLAVLSEDVVLEDLAMGITLRGRAGFRQWLQTWLTAAPGARTELTRVVRDGDCVATEHIGRGVHTGPLVTPAGTIPPTGRPFEAHFAEVFTLRAGQITAMRAYTDSASILRQLGVLDAPPSPATAS